MSHRVERTILIHARPATVWQIFDEDARFARWWGEGSWIEAREGGQLRIRYPDGSTATGRIEEVDPGRLIRFTYGYEDPSKGLAPEASTVCVGLREHPEGTLVDLTHEVPDAPTRDRHEPGWRYQLALLAKVAHDDAHAERATTIDRWFAAWNMIDVKLRRATIEAITSDNVRFADAYGYLHGHDELLGHLAAVRGQMAGVELTTSGPVRYMQGVALADWEARRGDKVLMAGTNVFELGPDGQIVRVTGVPA